MQRGMSAELLCAGTGGLGPDTAYHDRRFAGCVLVSDNESWVGAGRGGSTAVVIEWQAFVANQQRLGGRATSPKLICIDLQPCDHPGPGRKRRGRDRSSPGVLRAVLGPESEPPKDKQRETGTYQHLRKIRL